MEEGSFLNPSTAVQAAGIHEGMHVADLGAGSGFFTRAAARAVGEGGVVWSVDLNRDLLSRIKNFAIAEDLHNVEVMHGDVEIVGGSNLPAESFDFCITANVLFSAAKKGECVAEIRRLLKKSGRALVVDWSGTYGGLGPSKEHVVTAAQAQKLFETHGFALIGSVPAGEYHWGLVVRKKSA
jgi:ubiquinone/menaquinone biosynthesis C-methylase UbiE